ncbi:MAG: hypothetical protein EOO55_02355 [Hymenobacter sp.]|nr:MAG: hypothetical protein EOO55_02355 [Hymenobacter sp.]
MDKYFLYIDILGFSDLVKSDTSKVDELYEIIASLNVHEHDIFKAIIFSDTILIYNVSEPRTEHDYKYIVMYLCEFVQDLQDRLAGRNITYRAIITKGQFVHYEINGIPCFYGNALIDAYNSEKDIQAIGLFMDNSCIKYCDIFDYVDFDDKYKFVFTTKIMDKLEFEYNGDFPIDEYWVEQTDLGWLVMPEILTLENIYKSSIGHPVEKVKVKHINTIKLYMSRYPKTMKELIGNDFAPNSISPGTNWQEKIDRYPEDYSYIKKRKK